MFDHNKRLYIARSGDTELCILPQMANRHGLITGATGTGKTVTLQSLAESFSAAGVPVFAADIKGDLSGVSNAGGGNNKVQDRVVEYNLTNYGFGHKGYPVCFWDVYGEQGHPIRATISDMGPLMLSRLLSLNDTQSSVLSLIFKIADDHELLLLDLKDLKSMLDHVVSNRAEFSTQYGAMSAASIGAIQRNLMQLELEGGDKFFGEPALNIQDLLQCDGAYGVINILAADKLMLSPKMYSCLLLWMLAELFEQLPEVGDLKKPKMVFFFDEAHLLFTDTPKALVDKIEQTVRLIRSKGIGIYFITQNPADIPERILGQLGNRIQHALRAFTPNDQKAVRAAAQTFRANPLLDTQKTITELGVGEALVSFLDEKGSPQMVERAFILPPQGQIGPIDYTQRQAVIKSSLIYGEYEKSIDRASAFEILKSRLQQQLATNPTVSKADKKTKEQPDMLTSIFSQLSKSVSRQVGNELGRSITRGILGSIFGKK